MILELKRVKTKQGKYVWLKVDMSSTPKIKFQLGIKIYLVPNLENTVVRILITNITHLYDTGIEGNLTREKNIVAYVAYVEENGQLVPRVRFED